MTTTNNTTSPATVRGAHIRSIKLLVQGLQNMGARADACRRILDELEDLEVEADPDFALEAMADNAA